MRILIKGHIIIDSNIYICHPISSKVIYLAEQEDENNYDVVITGDLHVEEIADYVRLEQIIHKSYCPEEVHDWLIETREGSFEWLLGENEGEPATT